MENSRGMAALIDRATLTRGLDYARRGLATSTGSVDSPGEAVGVVRGSGPADFYQTTATYELDPRGTVTAFEGWCSCPVEISCKHAVALLFTRLAEHHAAQRRSAAISVVNGPSVETAEPSYSRESHAPQALLDPLGRSRLALVPAPREPSPWELALKDLVRLEQPATPTRTEPLGLLFQLTPPGSSGAKSSRTPDHHGRLAIRPVRLGQRGTWVRTGISWTDLKYGLGRSTFRQDHLKILSAMVTLSTARQSYYYQSVGAWMQLENLNGMALWELLIQARDAGLDLISDQKGQPPVILAGSAGDLSLDVSRDKGGLKMVPTFTVEGESVPPARSMFLGEPVQGLVTWSLANRQPTAITLARLDRIIDRSILDLFSAGGVRVPSSDESLFLNDYIPELRRCHNVRVVGESLTLPEEKPPVLSLSVLPLPGHQVRLEWDWLYRVGETERRLDLYPGPAEAGRRDLDQERRIMAEIAPMLKGVEALSGPSHLGLAPLSEVVTRGRDTIDLVNTILPMLTAHPDVEVDLLDWLPEYQPAAHEPVITLSSTPSDGGNDWFDLTVVITLGDQQIPFEHLFRALATDLDVMILADGSYFSLDREEFRQLRELIEEARSLQDRSDGQLRISRFQTALWEELEKLGVVDEQSSQWLSRVRGWRADNEIPIDPPPTLDAHLRPYQLDGYRWLNLLRENELGGILADDMGLGKTIQTLAMIGRAREQEPDGPPFLVLAPTSVISNWQAEAARFLPEAKTLVISETEIRRGIPLPEAIEGMDIVITSYTLFRLEFDDYQAADFAGLIMDEAQAVKNHQSKIFGCVKRLSVPFKFAITGTPMENNLMELWALFSLVAPGLFPNPSRFNDYYRLPIERGSEQELLDRLRRRIRPLMLRRTKEQVAIDLPPKQEQVLELELEPAHRRIYQRHLQRERQKVLGLLGDMEKNRFAIFRSLTLLRQASIDPFLVDPENAEVPSTKLNMLMELLADVVGEGHRTLVFSQFTGFLARVRSRLDESGIDYCYLDGSTRNRPKVLADFREGTAPVFLISLKAGGVGLNLTEADYCILLDPWWNPATEAQAVDRTHRIGQTKNVMVYRLVSKGTIEEKVMALKESKAKLFAGVMSDDGVVGKAITAADIRELIA